MSKESSIIDSLEDAERDIEAARSAIGYAMAYLTDALNGPMGVVSGMVQESQGCMKRALMVLDGASHSILYAVGTVESDNGECQNCEGRDRVFEKLRSELRYIDGLNDGQHPRGALAIDAILNALVELGMNDAPILWGEAVRLKRVRPEY